jgi:hypothetical protein
MATISTLRAPVHPSAPRFDHEGTRIDYSDDPTAWLYDPYLGPRKVPAISYPKLAEQPNDTTFLDEEDDSDGISQHPEYDAVFERPLCPGRPVELISLDGGSSCVIGQFKSLQQANDAAFRSGATRFTVRSI